MSPLAKGANQLGTSTTGDVRPASPAAAAPGDEAEAERFFEEYILCQWSYLKYCCQGVVSK